MSVPSWLVPIQSPAPGKVPDWLVPTSPTPPAKPGVTPQQAGQMYESGAGGGELADVNLPPWARGALGFLGPVEAQPGRPETAHQVSPRTIGEALQNLPIITGIPGGLPAEERGIPRQATAAETDALARTLPAQRAARVAARTAPEAPVRPVGASVPRPPVSGPSAVPEWLQPVVAGEQGGINVKPIQDYLARNAQSRQLAGSLGDRILQLQGERKASEIEGSRVLDQVTAGSSKGDMEAAYHALEKPRPLTPVQQQIYNVLKPIRDETQVADRQIASNLDRPVKQITDIGYVRRQPLGVGSQIDRVLLGTARPASGGILRKTTDGEASRVFTKLVNPETGDEMIARIDKPNGKVTAYGRPGGQGAGKPVYDMGNIDRAAMADFESTGQAQRMFRGRDGRMYQMQSPTTAEVEAWTGQRYYKNAAYSVLSDYHDTMAVKRATDFLASLPDSPDFASFAMRKGTMEAEFKRSREGGGWRSPDIPALSGYVMNPTVATKLESIVGRSHLRPPNALTNALFALQRGVVTAGLVSNPAAHPTNMAAWGLVNRGIIRWLNPAAYGRWFRSLSQAYVDTVHMNENYQTMLGETVPLQYSNSVSLGKKLVDIAEADLSRHPNLLTGMAQALATTPIRILQTVRQRSHDLAFISSDIATLSSVYERMAEGKPTRQAVAEAMRHFPTYRIPDWWQQAFPVGNQYTLFVPYHASSLEAFANMVRDVIPALSPETTAAMRLEAAEKLALLGLAVAAIAPAHGVVQTAIQNMTGNPRARLRAFGPLSMPAAATRVAMGELRPLYGATSVITPSPLTNIGISAVQARNLSEFLKNAQQSVTPFQLAQYTQNPGWEDDWGKTLLSMPASMFISTPPPKLKPSRPHRIGGLSLPRMP